ncbi:MAG TPA: helix-turn-helix transcriptional regulator, partial [Clostridiaceae bacterium]|nr:helix-turn-helix transcriptional regulator [Clostridiaceae bacterium]
SFKQETGFTFNRYINHYRIQWAIEFLDSNYSITDIALKVGFKDAKYFSQVFKKQTGLTPNAYRKKIQSERKRYNEVIATKSRQ